MYEWVHLNSSAIRAVRYDHEALILDIEFTDSETYDYHRVPLHIYEGLVSARSAGRYFHSHIKDRY